MVCNKRVVNKQDRHRLIEAIQVARRSWRTYGPYLDWLNAQLEEANACEPDEVPEDVVTMNSQVEMEDLRTGKTEKVTLVYPGAQQATYGAISVFEPTGLALLGSRVGDVLGWSDAERTCTAKVRRLRYQPEAAGDLHL